MALDGVLGGIERHDLEDDAEDGDQHANDGCDGCPLGKSQLAEASVRSRDGVSYRLIARDRLDWQPAARLGRWLRRGRVGCLKLPNERPQLADRQAVALDLSDRISKCFKASTSAESFTGHDQAHDLIGIPRVDAELE